MPFPYTLPLVFDSVAAPVSLVFAIAGSSASELTHPWKSLPQTDLVRQAFIAAATSATVANDQELEIGITLLNLSLAYPSLFAVLRTQHNPEIDTTGETPNALPLFNVDQKVKSLLLYVPAALKESEAVLNYPRFFTNLFLYSMKSDNAIQRVSAMATWIIWCSLLQLA